MVIMKSLFFILCTFTVLADESFDRSRVVGFKRLKLAGMKGGMCVGCERGEVCGGCEGLCGVRDECVRCVRAIAEKHVSECARCDWCEVCDWGVRRARVDRHCTCVKYD